MAGVNRRELIAAGLAAVAETALAPRRVDAETQKVIIVGTNIRKLSDTSEKGQTESKISMDQDDVLFLRVKKARIRINGSDVPYDKSASTNGTVIIAIWAKTPIHELIFTTFPGRCAETQRHIQNSDPIKQNDEFWQLIDEQMQLSRRPGIDCSTGCDDIAIVHLELTQLNKTAVVQNVSKYGPQNKFWP